MSNQVKIDEINVKLKNKLQSSSWNETLVPYIDSPQHTMLMDILISDMKKGLKFNPPLKEWFNEFNKPYEGIKMVIVTEDDENPLPTDDQGVLHLVVNKTYNDELKHATQWYEFNKKIISATEKLPQDVLYVFIGKDSYIFGVTISMSKRMYLPDVKSEFWDKDSELLNLSEKINNVLKSHKQSEIKW